MCNLEGSPASSEWALRKTAHLTLGQPIIGKFFFLNVYIYWLIWEREREIEINLLFHLFMYSLIDSCMCPDRGSNPQPWLIRTMLQPAEPHVQSLESSWDWAIICPGITSTHYIFGSVRPVACFSLSSRRPRDSLWMSKWIPFCSVGPRRTTVFLPRDGTFHEFEGS